MRMARVADTFIVLVRDKTELFEKQQALDLQLQTTNALAEEKARSDRLLYNMLPKSVADRLRYAGGVRCFSSMKQH